MNSRTILLFFSISLLAIGCTKSRETDLVTFPLRGEVLRIDTVRLTITVAHQAIPNYMKAMTMPFKVHDAGFVPCAVSGMSTRLGVRPFSSWYARIIMSPVSSPCAPAAG